MASEELLIFLKQLINNIENGSIKDDKLQMITEFRNKYLFNNADNNNDLSEADVLKYLYLGWYIYSNLKK